MQTTAHRRASHTSPMMVNGSGTNGHGAAAGAASPPARKQVKRRKKKKQRPSQVLEDWIAVIMGALLALALAYWLVSKIILFLLHGSDGDGFGSGGGGHVFSRRKRGGGGGHGKNAPMEELDPMPFNKEYHLPESHPLVGDRSNYYARIRQKYDELLPRDLERSLDAVKKIKEGQDASDYKVVPIIRHESHGSLHQKHRKTEEEEAEEEEKEAENGGAEEENQKEEEAELRGKEVYDIYNCPDTPVEGYPYAWPIMTILDNWSPDDVTIPEVIFQGLCVFDYQDDYEKAMNYRNAELPFIIDGDPEVARTVERWNYPGFMQDLMSNVAHRTEHSPNNHFMYHVPPKGGKRKGPMFSKTPDNYEPPTDLIRMNYKEWLEHANNTHTDELQPDQEHWYYRLIGCGLTGQDGSCDKGSSEYLYDELPFFQPVSNLYLVKGEEQKGIHCRFGMKGVIAENHFDGSRNAIVLLGGSRRYILAHPDQCEDLCLYPMGHPSARHSQVNYADPDLDNFPRFAHVNANEVIMQPGQVLFLPTHWFHYIVSLELNFQCNTRSGVAHDYDEVINECGF